MDDEREILNFFVILQIELYLLYLLNCKQHSRFLKSRIFELAFFELDILNVLSNHIYLASQR